MLLLSAQPGCRGPSEAASGLREGQRRREADEHRQQAESGPSSDPAPAAEGKRSFQTSGRSAETACMHACVCARLMEGTCEEHEEEVNVFARPTH